jgi:hypothetical protein
MRKIMPPIAGTEKSIVDFETWFIEKFGRPKSPHQEFVMSCCYHAWMASREVYGRE